VSGDALYHDELVRLAREARGAGKLDPPLASAALDNPLCGDRVAMEVRLGGGRIAALAHRVRGCLLCEAAASFLGGAAPGMSPAEVRQGRALLGALLAGEPPPAGAWSGIAVFEPVRAVKSRHRCVLLPFEALAEALARAEVQPWD
jgi:NifU-like protein involved in Fe-S cluster formation